MEIISPTNSNIIEKVVQVLSKGGLVIYPTETVYGVAVDATNTEAVTKLLQYKKRPEGKAISVACSSQEMASEYVDINKTAQNIYKEFLPGPVTVISKSKGKVDARLESEKKSLGIRIPDYNLILNIIEKFGKPITATSANSSGAKTPYSIQDIFDHLSDKQKDLIDLIIDAGDLPKALPSTVIDTTTDELKTYRSGKYQISNIKNQKEEQADVITSNSPDETIKLGQKVMQENLELLIDNCIVFLLHGDLGAGKTHFTKGIAKALGITRTVKSPTYTYVDEYSIITDTILSQRKSQIKSRLYHIDAWRIENKRDLETLGFQNWIKKGNILVVEWPEVIFNLIENDNIFKDAKVIKVEFETKDKNQRQINIISN